jgi:hypothetical protein
MIGADLERDSASMIELQESMQYIYIYIYVCIAYGARKLEEYKWQPG